MQPTKGPYASKAARQDVLQKAPDELQRTQPDGRKRSGFAFVIIPTELSTGQTWNHAVGSGGLEHVAREVPQRVFTRTGWAAVHVPMPLPSLGRNQRKKLWMLLLKAVFE